MIRTKSIHAPKGADDGRRVLITRYYPRGIRREHFDEWIRELAPGVRLLKLYKGGRISTREFAAQYRIEIDNDVARQIMHDIRRDSAICNITLLCHEPEGEFCHRYVLRDMINSMPI